MKELRWKVGECYACKGFDPVMCYVCRGRLVRLIEDKGIDAMIIMPILARVFQLYGKRIDKLERKVEWLTSKLREKKSESCSGISASSRKL